jgi:hypothetical protein
MGGSLATFKKSFKHRQTRCLMFYKLKLGEHVTTIPTIGST